MHKMVVASLVSLMVGAMITTGVHSRWDNAGQLLLGDLGVLPFAVATATLVFLSINSRYTASSLQNTRESLEHARRAEVATRFQKALELVQSENLATRIGGIAVLNDVATEAPKQYWGPIASVLVNLIETQSSVLREKLLTMPRHAAHNAKSAADVHYALDVLGLKNTQLRNAVLKEKVVETIEIVGIALCDLSVSHLSLGHLYVREAIFDRVRFYNCDLQGSTLCGHFLGTGFYSCSLRGSYLSFKETRVAHNATSFLASSLVEANVTAEGEDVIGILECDLTGTQIEGKNISAMSSWYHGVAAQTNPPSQNSEVYWELDIEDVANKQPVAHTYGFPIFRRAEAA